MSTSREATFNRFTLEIPESSVLDCTHPGPCDEDVAYWVDRVNWQQVDADEIRAELAEYGAWDDEELADEDANRRRILWIAAGNIADDVQ